MSDSHCNMCPNNLNQCQLVLKLCSLQLYKQQTKPYHFIFLLATEHKDTQQLTHTHTHTHTHAHIKQHNIFICNTANG